MQLLCFQAPVWAIDILRLIDKTAVKHCLPSGKKNTHTFKETLQGRLLINYDNLVISKIRVSQFIWESTHYQWLIYTEHDVLVNI